MLRADRRERRLLAAVQSGSAEAAEQLFKAYWPRAHRAALLIVRDSAAAEDIAQEAFVAALRSLDRFDRRRPFGPWLHRIVVNRAIDWARTRSLRGEAQLAPGDADRAGDGREEPLDPLDPMSSEVVAALRLLDPDRRAVIVMRYLLDYTPGEIAELLDLPRGTVNSRLRRALDALAEELTR